MTLITTRPNSKIVIHGDALQRLIQDPNGSIVKDLIRRATKVQTRARQKAGFDTGKLRASIVKRNVINVNNGISILIGSQLPYALLHHEGTQPHIILPKTDGGVLRWETVNGVMFATIVHHPGTRPNRYLTESLPEALV